MRAFLCLALISLTTLNAEARVPAETTNLTDSYRGEAGFEDCHKHLGEWALSAEEALVQPHHILMQKCLDATSFLMEHQRPELAAQLKSDIVGVYYRRNLHPQDHAQLEHMFSTVNQKYREPLKQTANLNSPASTR